MQAAARKYDYSYFEEKKAEIREVPKSKPQEKPASIGKILLVMVFVAASLSLLLYAKAVQTELNDDLETTKKMVAQAESENARLQVELEKKLSLTNLERQARALDMGEMQQRQVNYVRFETENKIAVAEKDSTFESLVKWVKGLFS